MTRGQVFLETNNRSGDARSKPEPDGSGPPDLRGSLIARIRSRFNVAVAEVADQDSWGRLTLAVACVSTDARHAHAMLQKVIDAIDRERLDVEFLDCSVELL